jgi:hypothetical protein
MDQRKTNMKLIPFVLLQNEPTAYVTHLIYAANSKIPLGPESFWTETKVDGLQMLS